MATTKKYLTVLGILVLLCAALGLSWYCGERAGQPRLYKTLAWEGCCRLLLRSPAEEPGVLLLRPLTTEESLAMDRGLTPATQPGQPATQLGQPVVVGRYAPPAKLKKVGRAEWEAAGGPVCDCEMAGVDDPKPFTLGHRQRDRLQYNNQAVATAGVTVLRVTVSPSRRYVAVLSAAGRRRDSLIPFWGGSGASGQHYHEVYLRADGKRLGKPVPLPLPSGRGWLKHCWSPDECYVVYTDSQLLEFCIVHTELTKEREQ
ncbi:MAG: hypothetical protein KAY37_10300 [Phycisphaerae bacterium]|nr:hypothetical protein [Phycisphaerae bacterium]